MKRTPTARRIQALLWAPGQMKREAAPKSAISHQGIKTMTGMWETSPRNQYKTDWAPGTHVRVHPLLDWTELDVWEYIGRENIPVVPLYFDQGNGTRYRSLGCAPCTTPVESTAKNVQEIIDELKTGKFANIAERSGRAQDKEGGGGLEDLRRNGYM